MLSHFGWKLQLHRLSWPITYRSWELTPFAHRAIYFGMWILICFNFAWLIESSILVFNLRFKLICPRLNRLIPVKTSTTAILWTKPYTSISFQIMQIIMSFFKFGPQMVSFSLLQALLIVFVLFLLVNPCQDVVATLLVGIQHQLGHYLVHHLLRYVVQRGPVLRRVDILILKLAGGVLLNVAPLLLLRYFLE